MSMGLCVRMVSAYVWYVRGCGVRMCSECVCVVCSCVWCVRMCSVCLCVVHVCVSVYPCEVCEVYRGIQTYVVYHVLSNGDGLKFHPCPIKRLRWDLESWSQ